MCWCWSAKKDRKTYEQEQKNQASKEPIRMKIPDPENQFHKTIEQAQSPHIIVRNKYLHNEEEVILNVRKPMSEQSKSENYSTIRHVEESKEKPAMLKNQQVGKPNQYSSNQPGLQILKTASHDLDPPKDAEVFRFTGNYQDGIGAKSK